MIVHCNFEELRALRQGAQAVLEGTGASGPPVAAPSAERARVERLLPRLEGDLTIETLAEQRSVAGAMETILAALRRQMESAVVATHPGQEAAVEAYFEFAHALSVLHRVREMGEEMEALIELVTGKPPTPEVARSFQFPD